MCLQGRLPMKGVYAQEFQLNDGLKDIEVRGAACCSRLGARQNNSA